jgi:hypothetical protein
MLATMAKRPQRAIPEVPKAIFEQFLNELNKDATLRDVATRLKPVLLENETLSEAAIKAALLPDDTDAANS